MMLGTAYILLMAGFAIQPTLVLYRWEAGYGNFNGLIPVWFLLATLASVGFPILVGRIATSIGAKYLKFHSS